MEQAQYEEAIRTISPGIYQHFKGNYYEVLYIARHSETTEPMVIYRALYGDRGVWARPAAMWNETVEHNGQIVPRFRLLNQVERIRFYEELFDEVSAAKELLADELNAAKELFAGELNTDKDHLADELNAAKDHFEDETAAKLNMLEDYYTSGLWLEDYETDEQGLLPEDLKRGVLSQDALYDLLSEE